MAYRECSVFSCNWLSVMWYENTYGDYLSDFARVWCTGAFADATGSTSRRTSVVKVGVELPKGCRHRSSGLGVRQGFWGARLRGFGVPLHRIFTFRAQPNLLR